MRSENSGLIDLDALLKEASQPELPTSADDSLETLPPVLEPPTPAPIEPPKSPPHPSSSSAVVVAAPIESKPSRLPWIVLVGAIGAVGLVLAVRRPHQAQPSAATSRADDPTITMPTGATPSPSPVPTAAGVSLGDLPAAAVAAAPAPSVAPRVPANLPASSAKLVAIADAPPAATGDLGGAMREAVGPRSSADIAVGDPTPGGAARQLKPSPGAVLGAISSVMPAARACLGEDDAVRSATIVFKSDGTVARVELPGSAHAADDCIRGALSKARTMPFVDDTFAARATVRP